MKRATIKVRLEKLKTLANAVNVPKNFTMTDNYKYELETLKENLEDNMEATVNNLASHGGFKYYNNWYRALQSICKTK